MSRSTVRLMVSCSTLSYKVNHMGNELLNNHVINIQVMIQPGNSQDGNQVVTQMVSQSMRLIIR
jgi:hypothetical protein